MNTDATLDAIDIVNVSNATDTVNVSNATDSSSARAYGYLPKDCWEMIGKHCKFVDKCKLASTCTKLKTLFFKRYDIAYWARIIQKKELEFRIKKRNQAERFGEFLDEKYLGKNTLQFFYK